MKYFVFYFRSLSTFSRSFKRQIRALPRNMNQIQLNEQEAVLRSLLLDVADHIAAKNGVKKPQLRFAGGWVRDKLLNTCSPDIDIAIDNMTGEQFAPMIDDFIKTSAKVSNYNVEEITPSRISMIAARPEQSKHLETATRKFKGLGIDVDIVNLRKETYADSRNPQMEFGTAEEDALRRDATINALFYNLASNEVEDFSGRGQQDLRDKIIRTPLSPYETFKDDPLRILRCIRFASRLGFTIVPEAEESMRDPDIRKALRQKITRERIGTEIEKMLKGPRPETALNFVDRLDLYDVIFTDPARSSIPAPNTQWWSNAYKSLPKMLGSQEGSNPSTLSSKLTFENEERLAAWYLCSIAPWTPAITPDEYAQQKGQAKTLAAFVAREGIKIDNKNRDIIDKSVLRLEDMIALKNRLVRDKEACRPSKRKQPAISREEVGMQLHGWGALWRCGIILANLVELMQGEAGSKVGIDAGYQEFWATIQDLDLMDAHNLKPAVDGKTLAKAVGRNTGPWMTQALQSLVAWQFRNPTAASVEEGIQEVVLEFKLK